MILDSLLSHDQIYSKWLELGGGFENALALTKEQLSGIEKIVNDDGGWNSLLEIAAKGRTQDAWLATDWPAGFDELILCLPLCKLVDWECAKCTIGSRQNNYSCANDRSLFGLVGVFVENGDRAGLKEHLKKIGKMLTYKDYKWDINNLSLVKI
jgi:hypothetical protein